MRQTPEALTEAAELPDQRELAAASQVGAVDDTQPAEFVCGDFAYAMKLGDWQGSDEFLDLIRRNDEQPVGLFPVAGDLGEKLVGRNARRHGDVQLIRDPTTDVLRDARGAAGKVPGLGHIQKGLIQRQRLYKVGVIAKDRVDFPRRFFIGIHARLDDGQVRAELERMPGRHGRTHAIGARLVITGRNHPAPLRRAAYRQRFAGEVGLVTHFNGCIKAVTVDVDDFALRHDLMGFCNQWPGSISFVPPSNIQ